MKKKYKFEMNQWEDEVALLDFSGAYLESIGKKREVTTLLELDKKTFVAVLKQGEKKKLVFYIIDGNLPFKKEFICQKYKRLLPTIFVMKNGEEQTILNWQTWQEQTYSCTEVIPLPNEDLLIKTTENEEIINANTLSKELNNALKRKKK